MKDTFVWAGLLSCQAVQYNYGTNARSGIQNGKYSKRISIFESGDEGTLMSRQSCLRSPYFAHPSLRPQKRADKTTNSNGKCRLCLGQLRNISLRISMANINLHIPHNAQ